MWVLDSLCILVSIYAASVNGATDPTDVSALRILFSSLNSPSQLAGWNSNGDDPCGQSWQGLTCSGSAVTELKIPSLGLTGSMGYQLDGLKSLTNLDISGNSLGGSIPYQLPPNLQRLNLASNSFSGGIPYSISQMGSLKYLNLSHNQLQGQLGDMFGQLPNLNSLDFSFNTLAGDLPESFGSLTSLNSMYLENNQFAGSIDVLKDLPLQNLNVANNQFSGWVPEKLKSINLQIDGNPWSSGPAPPPPPGSPSSGTRTNRNHNSGSNNNPSDGGNGKKSGIGGGGVAGIVISILVVGAIVAFFLLKKRSKRQSLDVENSYDDRPFTAFTSNEVKESKPVLPSFTVPPKPIETPIPVVSLRPPPIDRKKSFDEDDFSNKPIVVKKVNRATIKATAYSVADLQMATASFSPENLIGDGTIGRVYRAQFGDGKVLAVKKVNASALRNLSSEDFMEVVSNISQLHHLNIAELVGYCCEHGQYLLVYEFYRNGSLHDYLHLSDEYGNPLKWNTRVKIALGTARALEYLHEGCLPSVVHKNFKSANILLDSELDPHVSECGLASFISKADYEASEQNSSSGYGAPEVALSGQYTLQSDVYSFGVVMLELLTGRKPFDSSRPRSEQSLVRWAAPRLHDIDALTKMVDPALEGLYHAKSLSRFADVIVLCVQPEPEFRPPMSEVVQALVRLVQQEN
ncbi:hypothetical protein Scep_007994 [Stephania cephalantha]|uniref:Protein kinase domain-containing protein n=1 Tax=Stephania cephalantha TaxID=152367 RepID=A0AAP0KDJ9_9MAGN